MLVTVELAVAAYNVLRSAPPGAGRTLIAGACGTAALWAAAYPLLRETAAVKNLELDVDIGLAVTATLGIVVLQLELAGQRTQEAADRYRSMFENAMVGLFRVDRRGHILDANPALLELLACPSRGALPAHFARGLFADEAEQERITRELTSYDRIDGQEVRWRRADGREVRVSFVARFVRDAREGRGYFEGSAHDVTTERELRQQLEQAERLEALGRLAGGVAHDVNNVLTIVMSGAELALKRLGPDHAARLPVETLLSAAQGAADFTSQLLAFSRRRVHEKVSTDVNQAVKNALRMVESALGPGVVLEARLAEEAIVTLAGSGQIEQIVMNLALNARDAMPDGGRVSVRTERTTSFDDRAFGRLVVRDTGHGMDEETRRRAFEPFFTTKPAGKGTGLGLATVYGIVQQIGGHIEIMSTPGRGTVFFIDLPLMDRPRHQRPKGRISASEPRGIVILLVEDREMVRTSTAQLLTECGYIVFAAANAEEARTLASKHHIDLLLTDVVMPGVSGPELARELRAAMPRLRVLFMSGYSERDLFDGQSEVPLLEKPFTVAALTAAIQDAVRRPSDAPASGSEAPESARAS
jgi:PAS domain S-box-containing protein